MKIPWRIIAIVSSVVAPSVSVPFLVSKANNSGKGNQTSEIKQVDDSIEAQQKQWSSNFSDKLSEANKKTYEELTKLHEEFKKNKDSYTTSLTSKVNDFNECFQAYNDNVAKGWSWDYWKDVKSRLTDKHSKCKNIDEESNNNSDSTFNKEFKSPQPDFLKLVEDQTPKLEETTKSNFRTWLTSIEAEFYSFNEKINNYRNKKQCLHKLTHQYTYFYKSSADKCRNLK